MKTRTSKSLLALLIIFFMVISNILIVNQTYSLAPDQGPIGLHLDGDLEFIRPDNESLIYTDDSDETNWIVIEEEETPAGPAALPDIFIKPYNESLIYVNDSVEEVWIVLEEEATPAGPAALPDIFIKPYNESPVYVNDAEEEIWIVIEEEETPSGAPEFIQPDNASKLYDF